MINAILNRLRFKQWGITSKPLKEGVFEVIVDGENISLAHSTFNTEWLAQLGISAKAILELGSFDGGDGLRFTQAYPNCRVVSVEADPARFEIVKKNLNGSGAELVQTAICAENGPIDWFSASIDGENHAQGSIYRQTKKCKKKYPFVHQAEKPMQIDGIRIDSLCQKMGIKEVDLLHMDIEGAENVALQGLGELVPKTIFLEMREGLFENVPSSENTDQLLQRLGYSLIANLGVDRLYVHANVAAGR